MTIKINIHIEDEEGKELALDEVLVALRAIKKLERQKNEKSEPTENVRTLALPFDTSGFTSAWHAYIDMRDEIKKPLKPTAAKTLLSKLSSMGLNRSIDALSYSTANQWQGVWEPKDNNLAASPRRKPKSRMTGSEARYRLLREYRVNAARDWPDARCIEEIEQRKKG